MNENLKKFHELIDSVEKRWPDVHPIKIVGALAQALKQLSAYLKEQEEHNNRSMAIIPPIKKVIIKLGPLIYFSKEDEDVFVLWLKMIKCIEKIEFMGPEVQVVCSSDEISFNDKTNFNGIFTRYTLDGYDQLFAFKGFKDQFVDKE